MNDKNEEDHEPEQQVQSPFFMIVEDLNHPEITSEMAKGAIKALESVGAEHEKVSVPNKLDMASAISFATKGHEFFSGRRRFDGYITLGCFIKDDSLYNDHVYSLCLQNIQKLSINHSLAVGQGIFTCANKEDAQKKAQQKGAEAVKSVMMMLSLKRQFGMKPR